jgi:N-methylhydantoinase A
MLTPLSELVVAVDIGGTFTDITLADLSTGIVRTAKTPSTPHDPSLAFITGVHLALSEAGRAPAEITSALHGTTVATNLILEGKGARTALLTTQGFRHVLEIGRQDFPRRANLWSWQKPVRPVPPSRVFEVSGRIGADGSELAPLDDAAVRVAIDAAIASGAQAIAICLLHAWANSAHEARVAAIARAMAPHLAVTASHEILPVVREYERSMTTVLNATVMPAVSRYVARLSDRLGEAGIAAPLLLMQSNGGVSGAANIVRRPALTALSGPAAGVIGARAAALACGIDNIITVDIGGTSADIALVEGGRLALSAQGRVGGWPMALPMLDMVTIGAGGGSIARVTEDGALVVGPESAGADPGPAAYGRGGTEATVTDAHLVLGHLPASLLGGAMRLDAPLAAAAVARMASRLGLALHEAARGILAIADNAMVGAMRVVSVERGRDPRDFTLVPFGGAGPLHGAALARALGMRRQLIPPAPGVLCAQGLLAAERRAAFSRTRLVRLDSGADLTDGFTALQAEADSWFDAEGIAAQDRAQSRVALMRYHDQGSELTVPFVADATALAAAFTEAHAALYGFTLPHAAIELVTLRIEASARMPAPPAARAPAADKRGARVGEQRVWFADGARAVPVLARDRLGAGELFAGPAIVTQLDATTLVLPGQRATVQASGALLIEELA